MHTYIYIYISYIYIYIYIHIHILGSEVWMTHLFVKLLAALSVVGDSEANTL